MSQFIQWYKVIWTIDWSNLLKEDWRFLFSKSAYKLINVDEENFTCMAVFWNDDYWTIVSFWKEWKIINQSFYWISVPEYESNNDIQILKDFWDFDRILINYLEWDDSPLNLMKHMIKVPTIKRHEKYLECLESDDSEIDNNWNDLRTKVLDRDDYSCTECWKEWSLDVHHILPKKMWWQDEIDNLISLCRECHEDKHPWIPISNYRAVTSWKLSKKIIALTDAIEWSKTLEIKYEKYQWPDKITTRKIEPFRLYYKEWKQYVEAFCLLRWADRHFRISRIKRINNI